LQEGNLKAYEEELAEKSKDLQLKMIGYTRQVLSIL
jgi:hypothetical protein